ncbi:MAG: phytoene dehydrogenase [Patescibacteria group bacterium]|nr:MAG: phytoene dehydrogenase [Patescibacteria group bacterium]
MHKKILVIGGGIGGLAVSALLAKDGFKITLLEKNKTIGGRARFLKLDEFYFDMGPSWYMMPEVFENFFSIFDKKVKDFYQLKKLKINYRVFFDDNDFVDIYSDIKKNFLTFKKYEKDGDIKLKKILNEAKYIYETSMKNLVFSDYKNLFQLIKPEVLLNFLRFDIFQSLHSYIERNIKNPKLQKILEYTTVFLGGSPYNTPAFYKLVAHADMNLGIYYPIGGMYKIVEALEKLCNQYNVRIKTDEEVKKIFIKDKKIYMVETNKGKKYRADIFVVNADYPYFETKLLPKQFQTYNAEYWDAKTFSPSAFIIYLGIKDNLRLSRHHNLYFVTDWKTHFDDVYKNKRIPKNPSFYYHIPSKTDQYMAPSSCHSVMILVPMPPGVFLGKEEEKVFYSKILKTFSKINKLENIEEKILVKKFFQAKDFFQDYNAYFGSAFGIAHTLSQTALFRPRNYSKKIKNLFYVGQHTNPGIGIPPVLISAQIVYNLIKNYEHLLLPNLYK